MIQLKPPIALIIVNSLCCVMLTVSCGGAGLDSTDDSSVGDSAQGVSEFIPTTLYWAVGEAQWDGSQLTSFRRDSSESGDVEPYIDFRLLEPDFLQQVTADSSCFWHTSFGLRDALPLSDPLEHVDTESNWEWVYLPLEFAEIDTDCSFSGFSESIESVKSLELTLSLGPVQQSLETEVVQMIQSLGYEYSDIIGYMYGVRLGWTTSGGEDVWKDIGWGVTRRLNQGLLLTNTEGRVELLDTSEALPLGALAIYGMYGVELEQLF